MIIFIRCLFVLCCAAVGWSMQMQTFLNIQLPHGAWISAVVGGIVGSLIVLIDIFFKQYTVRNILSVIVGLAFGLLTHKLFMTVVAYGNLTPEQSRILAISSAILFSYLGIITILRGGMSLP